MQLKPGVMPSPPDKADLKAQAIDGEMEKQKEAEKEKEGDAPDGFFAHRAETSASHRRAAEKQRYNTLGYQKKKQRHPVDFSTVSKGTSGNTKSRGALMQVLFNQSSSEKTSNQEERGAAVGGQEQVEVLRQTLESFPVPAELSWRWGEEDKDEVMEKSWTDIVVSHESMSKTQRHQQEALWELIHTEFIYITKLTIITDFVLAALECLHQRGFLLEVTSAHLFSNLPSILHAHKLFWLEVLYPMLKDVRLSGKPFDPLKLEPGCLQFAERFSAYLDYCWEEERNVEFTRKMLETNPHFQTYLTWVETHPQCVRMRLGDMQAKPHQRITKYPLLLKAVLKTTEDPHTQRGLHRMLTSVAHFLDSINDYLEFKDNELALFVLSQRIEGYEMQGMNEEIDKYMQEFCHFDLTSPIRGMGANAIRKLLLAETLKVRGRKDSKLEVEVLLFTDVLLLTKTQKKSDKQKVVRPPLSLERIKCAELKDGYSFVLVEVSDLGGAVSVYSVSAPSPEICTAWVSAIHQAQEVLETLRKNQNQGNPQETHDQDELEESESLPCLSQATGDKEKQPEGQSEFSSTSLDVSETGLKLIDNELESEELQSEVQTSTSQSHPLPASFINKNMQSGEITDKATQESEETKSSDCGVQEESGLINERRVTWTHKIPNSSDISHEDLEPKRSNGPHPLLIDGLMENTTPNQSPSNETSLPSGHIDAEPTINTAEHEELTPMSYTKTQGACNHPEKEFWKPDEESELLSESWKFSRKLKSPRLRRKRPKNPQPSALTQGSRKMSGETHNRNSFSDSDSHSNNGTRRPSTSSSKPQDSHLVLNLGSLKKNRVVLWNIPNERLSPDLHTLSEPELHHEMPQNFLKVPKMKSQRSASIPEVIYSNTQSLTPSVPNRPCPSSPSGLDLPPPSPLQGLLERAKERDRERRQGKSTGKSARSFQTRISVSSTPSPSPSEGERETEGEDQELLRTQGKAYLHRERESSVDGSEKEKINSPGTPIGASVDWPGWCFDDEEVLEFLKPYDGRIDWFDQTLTTELQLTQRQEDGEYSEV